MRLIELELTNFKGIRSFSIYLNGSNARVFGDNATGKTTLMDAFVWVLTGKDHLGRSNLNFDIKTLENGTVIPMIEHTVLARIEHEGCQVELIRTFKEVWQKKTGTNVETFTGHKTEYLIDGVPKSEKDYSAFIERLVPTNLLKLLLSPAYFNEQLKAEERRKLLLEMCGDLDESEMLSMPEWAELAANITKFVSVADLKKSMTAQKTKINDDLKSIPVAINVHTQYLNVSGVNSRSERLALNELQPKIDELERDIAGIRGEILGDADLLVVGDHGSLAALADDQRFDHRAYFMHLVQRFGRDRVGLHRDHE
jgi:DNA repair exonuclease SbcCD ATPase subunit